MLKNGAKVIVRTFTPTGNIVERKFFGEGENEELKYLVRYLNSEGQFDERWFTEDEITEA